MIMNYLFVLSTFNFMYICILCVYMYIMCMYIHMYTHIYIHVYIRMYIYVITSTSCNKSLSLVFVSKF